MRKTSEYETKRRNGTFSTSRPEEEAYELLRRRYGDADVERQYSSAEYPFRCDFHVTSLDMYVECNFHWTHGGRWFDPQSEEDRARLAEWRRKGKFYKVAADVWSRRDPAKREAAESHGLNYRVFWDLDGLRDFLDA